MDLITGCPASTGRTHDNLAPVLTGDTVRLSAETGGFLGFVADQPAESRADGGANRSAGRGADHKAGESTKTLSRQRIRHGFDDRVSLRQADVQQHREQ
jgi:hypothetical protein